jgi:hypothetical protein
VFSIKNSIRKAPSVSDVTVCVGPSFLWNFRHNGGRLNDFDELLADRFEVFSGVPLSGAGQCAGNIFPEAHFWEFSICCFPHFLDDSHGLHEESAACGLLVAIHLVLEALAKTRHTEVLARRSEGDDIHRLNVGTVHFADVTEVLHIGEATSGDCDGIGLDLGRPHWLDAA